jgi:hypothetical protein
MFFFFFFLSSCSVSCEVGSRTRERTVSVGAIGMGSCRGTGTEYSSCFQPPCPVPCLVTGWSEWSACSSTCGELTFRQRIRTIYRDPLHGAPPCPSTLESESCDTPDCPTPAPTPSPTPVPTPEPTPHPTPELRQSRRRRTPRRLLRTTPAMPTM